MQQQPITVQAPPDHDSIDLSKLEPPKQPRRKSLPSIVKADKFKEDEIAHSSAELNPKNQQTFIIENGIKKRVVEKNNSKSTIADAGLDENGVVKRRIKIQYDTDETPQLPRKMVIESNYNVNRPTGTTNSKRVSMPSINSAHVNPMLASKGETFAAIIIYMKWLCGQVKKKR